jgi:hypothetical protein
VDIIYLIKQINLQAFKVVSFYLGIYMKSVFSLFQGKWFHANPTLLCSPTLVDWNSYHKFHRHMKILLSNNHLKLLLPSQTHGGGASTSSIASTWSSIHIFVKHSTETHKPTSPTIDRPLGAPSSFLPSQLPPPRLSFRPPLLASICSPNQVCKQKQFITHPIEP